FVAEPKPLDDEDGEDDEEGLDAGFVAVATDESGEGELVAEPPAAGLLASRVRLPLEGEPPVRRELPLPLPVSDVLAGVAAGVAGFGAGEDDGPVGLMSSTTEHPPCLAVETQPRRATPARRVRPFVPDTPDPMSAQRARMTSRPAFWSRPRVARKPNRAAPWNP